MSNKSELQLISQAVKVLSGEQAYNQANLDQYLMGIQKINVSQKKKVRTLNRDLSKNKLSKADEIMYLNYSSYLNNQILKSENQDLPINMDEVKLIKNDSSEHESSFKKSPMRRKESAC